MDTATMNPAASNADDMTERICKLQERYYKYEQIKEDEFVKSCGEKLDELNKLTENNDWLNSEEKWCAVVENYIRGLLDLTFYEENKLVDADFLGEGMEEKVLDIIESLTDAESICKESTKGSVINVLGPEYAECLLWRKGALLYMFCHQKQLDQKWLDAHKEMYSKFLKRGIMELKKMFSVREKDEEIKQMSEQDAESLQLVEKGIFSDTHLLALMYAGEMCYWFVKILSVEETTASSDEEKFDPIALGKEFLEHYIEAVGIIGEAGWNSDRAKELLDFLVNFKEKPK